MLRCPFCGWPDDDPVTTVSVHPTPSGVTMWTRCACGSLQARRIYGSAGVAKRVLHGAKAVVTARSRPVETTATA